MVNINLIIVSVTIEAVVDRWSQSIVGDLENGCQAAYEHVGQIFEIR